MAERALARGLLALAALTLALAAAAPVAEAAVVATLPGDSYLTDVAVTPSGGVWVARSGPGRRQSGVGTVGPDGAVRWTPYPIAADRDSENRVLARPDGGIWALLGGRFPVRSLPDGTLARTGPLWSSPGPTANAVAVTPDGALVATELMSPIVRMGLDGAASTRAFQPPKPRDARDTFCAAHGMTSAPDGSLWLADWWCHRALQVRADDSVRSVQLPSRLGIDNPTGVLALPSGELVVSGAVGDGSLALISAAGASRVPLPGIAGAGRMALAPDGSVWMPADGSCALYHLTGRKAEKLPAPFPVEAVAAAADGSLWLAGWSKLLHLSPSELSEPTGECGGSGPRVTLPDVSRRGTVSLRALRRAGGLRVRSSRAGTLLGRLSAGGLAVGVQQAVGPGGAVIRFPARAFDGIARRLADGKRTSVRLLEMRFLDSDGNEGVHPDDPRVVR